MKRISRFLFIGLLHSTIYLWILPDLIMPNVRGENHLLAAVITSLISMITTVSIVRLPKFLTRDRK